MQESNRRSSADQIRFSVLYLIREKMNHYGISIDELQDFVGVPTLRESCARHRESRKSNTPEQTSAELRDELGLPTIPLEEVKPKTPSPSATKKVTGVGLARIL